MKSTVYDFTPPNIIGALGDDTLDRAYATSLDRALRLRKIDAVCLPFRVAPRHLKNVIACMRLMDIIGLAIHPSHQRRIMKFLPSVEKRAREAGFVDVVVKRGKRLVGLNARSRARDKTRSQRELERVCRSIILDLILG